MHELGIAIEIAERAVERAGTATIRKVVVGIGRLAAVSPDALAFAWDVAIADTTLEGATLEIIETDTDELTLRSLEAEVP